VKPLDIDALAGTLDKLVAEPALARASSVRSRLERDDVIATIAVDQLV
jgi:hypothetical protein